MRSFGSAFSHPWTWIDANGPGYRTQLLGYFTWPLVLLGVVGVATVIRRRNRVGLVLLGWLVVPLAVTVLVVNVPNIRYVVPILVPFVVFVAVGLVEAAQWVVRLEVAPSLKGALVGLLALALVPALVLDGRILASPTSVRLPGRSDLEYETGWSSGNGVEQLANQLRRRQRPDEVTVVGCFEQCPYFVNLAFWDDPALRMVRTSATTPDEGWVVASDPEIQCWYEAWSRR